MIDDKGVRDAKGLSSEDFIKALGIKDDPIHHETKCGILMDRLRERAGAAHDEAVIPQRFISGLSVRPQR